MSALIVFFVVIFTSAIFASFQSGNPRHSIDKIYGPLRNISGWINISFDEEPVDSVFSAFFGNSPGNSISIQELIEIDKNPSYVNSCTPLNCSLKDYSATNGASSKTFDLNLGVSKVFGLTLTGNLFEINSASFNLQSDAPTACVNQIEIDIRDDGDIDFINNKTATEDSCSNLKISGCYDALEDNEEYTITLKPYCQKMDLSESPGFYLGAWVKKVTGSLDLNMTLYDNYGVAVATCALPEITSLEGDVFSCDIDYSVLESKEYYVCISSIGGTGEYKIRGYENPSEGCGFYNYPPSSNTPAAYDIFAEGRKFDSVGTIEILNTLPNGGTFGGLIENYIQDRYDSLDCSAGCVVPIKFISGIDQTITINNLALNYEKETGIVTDNKFYDLTESSPKISSDSQRLFIDEAGFSVPSNLGSYDFSLKLNNQIIFSEDIEVKDVPIINSLTPRATAIIFPTEFSIIISHENANISSYNWDFGDDTTETTPINKAVHIYSEIGIYNLKITVTDTIGLNSSREFEINVSSPRNLIETTLNRMNVSLQNLRTNIQNQTLFHQTSLNSILRIENISSELERLEQQFSVATNNSEYLVIVENLLGMRIPENIFKTKQANSFLFFPEKSFIDMDIVKSIGGGNYESNKIEDYRDAAIAWQQENIEVRMDFNEFSGEYDSDIGSLVNIFEIRIDEKNDIGHEYYLIIPKLQDIGFDENVEEKDGFVYINLRGISRINFYTTEDIDFSDLSAFISPPINRLVVDDWTPPEESRQKLIIFILSMVSLIILGIISYVIIYQWYKRKYEKYLFKNRNDLYNIVTYVNNAKKKGSNNKKISRNLKKAGWGSEQIRYIMKKYEGKRTGIVRLPLVSLISKVKKEDSHQKHGK